MNIDKIIEQARIQYGFPENNECIKVTVAAAIEQDISRLTILLREWAERSSSKGKIIMSGSFGYFDLEPVVIIKKPGAPPILYTQVTESKLVQLIGDYIQGEDPRPDLALCVLGSENWKDIPASTSLPLFRLQKRIALRNCGHVDPEDINHYIVECRGYSGLSRVLEMNRIEVIAEMRRSCLRDTTDAGNLTVDKWTNVLEARGDQKFVICNAVDSEMQTRIAGFLLSGDPHSVVEGLLIAAYSVGASRCIIAVNTDNDGVAGRLRKAIEQALNYGLLGEAILDSNFNCRVEIVEVAPSLVLADKTALLSLLEGGSAMPYLWNRSDTLLFHGKPTLIESAETLANVSAIFQKGVEWYSDVEVFPNRGSKVMSLSGAVVHRYTVEVPSGITFGDIIYEVGGGAPDGSSLKGIRLGGSAGAYLGAGDLNSTLDYCDLFNAIPFIGSGIIDVIADGTCIVEMMDISMEHIQAQSCGKCVFCREGTIQISEILKDVIHGEGEMRDLDLLKELAEAMKVSSLCDLGRNAANQVLSSLRLFSRDYDVHIKDKRCSSKSLK